MDGYSSKPIEQEGVSNDQVVHGPILTPKWISST